MGLGFYREAKGGGGVVGRTANGMVAPGPEALYFAAFMIRRLLIFFLLIYRYTLSPFLSFIGGPGSGCRFIPSCSEYAREAIEVHGAGRGLLLTGRRICRCHPWGGYGFDPVPPVAAGNLSCVAATDSPRDNPSTTSLLAIK